MRQIVLLQVKRLEKRLAERKMSLKLSESAIDFLAEIGYDPVYGARPLKRGIQRELETQMAKGICGEILPMAIPFLWISRMKGWRLSGYRRSW